MGLCAVSCRGNTWRPPLKIMVASWAGNSTLYAAHSQARFAPVDVQLVMLSTDFDAWRALIEHRADMMLGTVFDLLRAIDRGADLRFVMAIDFSKGADGIVAREGFDSVASLKGKRVAVERCEITHYVLLRALQRAGLQEDDVVIENLATEDAVRALDEGRVDAAALWEPFLSIAKQKSGRRILFTSAEIPGEVVDVLAARADTLSNRRQDIENIIRGIHVEVDEFGKSRDYAVKTLMFENEIQRDVAEQSLDSLHFVTAAENKALFDRSGHDRPIWKAYELAANLLQKHNMLRHPPRSPDEVIDGGPLSGVVLNQR